MPSPENCMCVCVRERAYSTMKHDMIYTLKVCVMCTTDQA